MSDDKIINRDRTYGIVFKTQNLQYNFIYNKHLKLLMTHSHLPLYNKFDTILTRLLANRRSQDLLITALCEAEKQTGGVDQYYKRGSVVVSTLLPNITGMQKKALTALVFLCHKIRNRCSFGYPIEVCV